MKSNNLHIKHSKQLKLALGGQVSSDSKAFKDIFKDTPFNPNLSWAHPLVREWFIAKFQEPTEPQIQGWPPILAGKTTLISAPTGSGKTLTAFLACINALVKQSIEGTLENKTEVLYISPLKALSNDIQKNLMQPLAEIKQLAKEKGIFMEDIQVSVRTGDTANSERQKMLKKPPHILVTTPESLYILLTAEKSRHMLVDVKTIIVDEIHAIANSKRGSHLSLSLQRLDAITLSEPIRIGLSATQKPIEAVADFLTNKASTHPTIVNIGYNRPLQLSIEIPEIELGPVASNEMWDEIYDKIAAFTEHHRSILVFVNTRRLSERIAHHLTERLGEDKVAAHHGSLSRKLRLNAETRLKNGELKVLVATASLELGIDIGSIDLVCQIGSPRAIATALQRVGRAGHWHGGISKGILFATTRDELLECAALIYAIQQKDLDTLIIPDQPIDILAQQIVALCSTNDWQIDALYQLIIKALPYRNLSRETFNSIVDMLSQGIAGSRGRYGAYLHHDQVNGIVKARRGARMIAIMNGGAIPDNGLFTVIAEPDNVVVGTLDEDFAIESNRGDIILLGTTSWQVKRIENVGAKVIVENANGAPPSVPFWLGEAPARTDELSSYVSKLRTILNEKLPMTKNTANNIIVDANEQPGVEETLFWLQEHCKLGNIGARQLIEYVLKGRAILGAIPTQNKIIAERFFDEAGGMQLIIHAPFGARINKAWGLALRKKFCRSFNFELQAAATDNGINISLAEQHSFPLSDVFQFLHINTLKKTLIKAVLDSPLFGTRWRWVATRSLALHRFRQGKKVPPNIQRILSDDLLAAVFPDAAACQDNIGAREIEIPDHPLINETMKDVLTEALDIEGLAKVLEDIHSGKIECLAIDTPLPSVFSNEILNANPYAFLDDAPLEERRARAVEMRRTLPDSVLKEVGKLSLDAIQEVQQTTWPDVRNPDELHDLLQTLIALPAEAYFSDHQHIQDHWQDYFEQLRANGRAGLAVLNEINPHSKQSLLFWLATEKMKTFQAIFPNATLLDNIKEIEQKIPTQEEAMVTLLRGYMLHLGPVTASQLSMVLQLALPSIEQALLTLENSGMILRGRFIGNTEEVEWCERRLLARIHKATLAILRKEIEPVSQELFMNWLLKWQHVKPGTQLNGEPGVLEVIRQLQGYEVAANAWETQIFGKRIKGYHKELLDQLCLKGIIGFGRLSTHPVLETENKTENTKRVVPRSNTPITFFIREEAHWMADEENLEPINESNISKLSLIAQKIYAFLKRRGASFQSDIVKMVGHYDSEVELGLWELVASGAITADSFDNLRSLIDPKRRLDTKRLRSFMQFSAGRWCLLELHDYTQELPLDNAKELQHNKKIENYCRLLLKRYGVVFRDLLTREKNIPRWRDLLMTFRRLEDRGEIRGGRFVHGFMGEQFALPYAVDSLRAMKNEGLKTGFTGEKVEFSSQDPLNLVGIILPGAKISSNNSSSITLKDGKVEV